MAILERLKNMGARVVGLDEGSKFNKETERLKNEKGVTEEEAQKEIFHETLEQLKQEMMLTGTIDRNSAVFRKFVESAGEIFGPEMMNQFEMEANNPENFNDFPKSPSGKDLNGARSGYSRRFKGEVPDSNVLRDVAAKNMEINAAIDAFVAGTGGPESLQKLVEDNPELGAYLGKIIKNKERLNKHEKKFGRDIAFENEMKGFKETAKKELTDLLWKNPVKWAKSVLHAGLNPSFKNFFKLCSDSAEFMGKSVWSGAKFIFKGIKTGVAGVRKLTAKL
ncbi:MAG TPA: hypothetical protein VMX18_04065 [Candidatus Bipolaricaulota bacterium]|nr:hypothetical protein [Candidatus Bipolaricaulota bacterium]